MRNRELILGGWLAFLLSGCEFETAPLKPKFKLPAIPDAGVVAPGNRLDDGGAASGSDSDASIVLPSDIPPEFLAGGRAGAACNEEKPCRAGLSCSSGECEFDAESKPGDACIASAECEDGQCITNQCVPAGEAKLGEGCLSAAECEAGLRCGVLGLSTQCLADGTKDVGSACESSNECLSGLTCFQADGTPEPTCSSVPGAPAAIPTPWEGVACEEQDKETIRAFFEIPGAPDAEEGDYFRLPFPNDVLTDLEGRVNVQGFPTPGVNPLVGVDPIQPYVDVADGMQGWGTNGTATFRFSGRIDFKSFDESGAVHWVDITDPDKPVGSGINYRTFSGNTNYVCHNVFSVRRANGSPMEPGHTYAVWLGASGRSESGLKIERAENFVAMLEGSAPANKVLSAAHAKYAPFREYLAAESIAPADVLVATVITVGPARSLMSELAGAVRETDVPTASEWTLCGEGDSPCPQAEGGRACGTSDAFDEYHALIELPVFQQGEPPYSEEGGKITTAEPVRKEDVCASLTVPKGATMPAEGWPAVVFTHGTGGSFRSHIANGVAEAYAAAATPDGVVNFAVLGFDQVQHGPRRGESTESPDNLFFNFLNPDAAQGNPLQGAADVISIGRFMASLDLSAEDSGGDAVLVDPARIVFFGHSQGSMHGSLGLPFAPEYQGAVLSGNGASLMHALLTKTAPVNVAAAVPLVVNDGVKFDLTTQTLSGSLPGGAHHPVLTLIQQVIDPADPMNFALQISRAPLPDQSAKHVFQTYGQGDTYSPPLTMEIYARASRLSVVQTHSSVAEPDNIGEEAQEFPLLASFGMGESEFTVGVRQYAPPEGKDGHFVVFDVADAKSDALRFLGMAANGRAPQIGE